MHLELSCSIHMAPVKWKAGETPTGQKKHNQANVADDSMAMLNC